MPQSVDRPPLASCPDAPTSRERWIEGYRSTMLGTPDKVGRRTRLGTERREQERDRHPRRSRCAHRPWRWGAILLVASSSVATPVARADPPADEATAIDINVTNPIGTDWLLKLESNTYLLDVEEQHTRRIEQVVQLQPRIPIQITEDLLFLTRPTFNLFESDPYENERKELERATGIGDTEFPMVLSPSTGPNWLVAAGPTFVLPTATSDHTGKGKWQAGPAAVVGWKSSEWLAAVFAQQWWSFAGSGQRKEVSELKVQYYLTRFFHDGWSVGMSPTVIVNWKADSGQKLTFPVGLGVGKVLELGGGRAVKVGVQLLYMPIHPDQLGREANLQVTFTPVLATPIPVPLFPGSP